MKRLILIAVVALSFVGWVPASQASTPAVIAEQIARLVEEGGGPEGVLKALLADETAASFFKTAQKKDLVQLTMKLGGGEVGFATGGRIVLQAASSSGNAAATELMELCAGHGGGCPMKNIGAAIDEAATAAASNAPKFDIQPLQPTRLAGRRGRPKVYRSSFSTNYDYLQSATLDQKRYPAMNVRKIEPDEWILIDEQFAEQLAMKRELFELRKDKVFYIDPKHRQQAREGGQELLDTLVEYLPRNYPEVYEREGKLLVNKITGEKWNVVNPREHPLSIAGRLVQEDLTLVWTNEAGEHILVGGSVSFPSNWVLQNFAGLTVADLHSAVPGFKERLEAGVNRLLTNMRSEQLLGRNNWFVYEDPTLSQPGDRVSNYPVASVNKGTDVADGLFLRSERETLRRLPKSQMIVFTIREHVYPMRDLEQFPEVADRLATGIRNVSSDAPEPYAGPVLDYLDSITGGGTF